MIEPMRPIEKADRKPPPRQAGGAAAETLFGRTPKPRQLIAISSSRRTITRGRIDHTPILQGRPARLPAVAAAWDLRSAAGAFIGDGRPLSIDSLIGDTVDLHGGLGTRRGGASSVVALRGVVATVVAVAAGSSSAVVDRAEGRRTRKSFIFCYLPGPISGATAASSTAGCCGRRQASTPTASRFKMLLNGGRLQLHFRRAAAKHRRHDSCLPPSCRAGISSAAASRHVFAGPVVQDYRLTPDDPGSRLRRLLCRRGVRRRCLVPAERADHGGVQRRRRFDRPNRIRCARHSVFALFAQAFVGPETEEIWCGRLRGVPARRARDRACVSMRSNGRWAAAGR